VRRNATAVGLATGAYGISFGALGVAAHLSVAQTCVLSLLMFTGASQFAFVGVIGAGGTGAAAVATAALLGSRNAFYGLHLSQLLGVRGGRRALAAHLVIDESVAMAVARPERRLARLAFWSTGWSVFLWWNVATLVGALGTEAFADPENLGLDAAAPAAFVALLAPRLKDRSMWLPLAASCVLALVLVPFVPVGVPVLVVAGSVIVVGLLRPAEPEAAS
jgi:predicted branched-subunit amino acid permease